MTFPENTPFVVAETDAKHGGYIERLTEYITAIADAGADAVKFQIRVCDAEVSEEEQWRPGTEPDTGETRADYWRRIELHPDAWLEATAIAKDFCLTVGASVFSPEGVKVAVEAGVDYLKIGSGHVGDDDIVGCASIQSMPLILSDGMGNLNWGRVMQCQSIYPTPITLCRRFREANHYDKNYFGYSCHTGTIEPVIDAMSRGAKMVEVHVKLQGDNQWPDSSSSVTMKQLKRICRHRDFIREASNWTAEKQAECDRLTEETRQAIHTGKRFK